MVFDKELTGANAQAAEVFDKELPGANAQTAEVFVYVFFCRGW